MINASVSITVSLAVPVLKGFELNFFKFFTENCHQKVTGQKVHTFLPEDLFFV